MSQASNHFQIFESTQVSLNVELLTLIPATIDQSAFFIELAEEMELTFCEQVDNGCPVLLGLWNNILKAEKKLEEFLELWGKERNSINCSESLPVGLVCKEETLETDILVSDSHSTLIPLPENPPVVSSSYDPSIFTNSSQVYIVSSDISQLQTIADVKTALLSGQDHLSNKTLPALKNTEDDPEIKEIYVDIAVNSLKNLPLKSMNTSNECIEMKSADQNPLDKLCQLLCIEEDETIDNRLCQLEKNKKHEESLPYKYFCDQCSFKTKRENQLLKHVKLHEKIKDLFCCNQCDFKTIRESVLCRHKIEHSSTLISCKLCPYKTHGKNFLIKHVKVRHGPSSRSKMKCSFCDYFASTPRELHKHQNLLHKPEMTPKFWKCSKCPYKSKLSAHLKRHENDVHGSLRQFLCHYCGKSFKRNDTLTQHKAIHGEVNKTYNCQTCGKTCISAVCLREHLATHTTERPFLCDICGSSFKTRGATQRHKRSVHCVKLIAFPCDECYRNFRSKTDLNRHRKTHRRKTEAAIVPAVMMGANVQDTIIGTPITIQVVYTGQIDHPNQDVTIK